MSFKFFSKPTSPSQPAPAGIAPGLPSRAPARRPLDTPESATPVTEADTLSVFLPEDSSSASPRALTAEGRRPPSRSVPAFDARDTRAGSAIDAKRLDDLRTLIRQTQSVHERLTRDASVLRVDLSELRSLGEHLAQGYARLDNICGLTEQRSELANDVLNAIEKRIEPLEALRDLADSTEAKLSSLKQLAEEVTQRGASFEIQKQAIDQGREEAMRVGRLMEGLHARLTTLTEEREWLGQAEETVARLEHRAVETTAQLERRVGDFNSQKQTIDEALTEATHVTAILSALEKRIAALTGGEHGLGHAADAIEQLEQRAGATIAELDRRVGDFDAQKQTIEHALVAAHTRGDQEVRRAEENISWLERRAAETTTQLEERVNNVDALKQNIEQALVSARTESDRGLKEAAARVGRLEQQAAEVVARLERRVSDFDTQKETIERAAAEATRVTTILRALEERLAALDGSHRGLRQAEKTVSELERRAANARVRLEQVATGKDEVERELERVGKQLQILTESARTSVRVLRSTDASRAAAWSPGRPFLRWATILGILVAVLMLGIIVPRTGDSPLPAARTITPVHQETSVSAPDSFLPSRPSPVATLALPTGRPVVAARTQAANQMPSANRRDQLPARQDKGTAAVFRPVESGNLTIREYVGVLAVDSEPTGSVVFVDRERVGETPLQLTRLRAGSHVVRIERDGYERWTTAVHVAADKETRVTAKLQAARDR